MAVAGKPAGRFAPSPTGPLHLGSLLAATASYLDARALGMDWQVRLDDLDTPRNSPGADAAILRDLDRHGLHWDGPVVRQSEQQDRYAAALDALAARDLVFYCRCSRKSLDGHRVYPGTCRSHRAPRSRCAIRLEVGQAHVHYNDLLLGPQHAALADTVGDFVLRRRDGVVAYQLATAVDDGDPLITRVIRGRDLLDNTPRQILLMRHLGLTVPAYGHIPLLVNRSGQKLSKQTHARPLDPARPAANLARIMGALGLHPEPGAAAGECPALLDWAQQHFSLAAIPRQDTAITSDAMLS